MVVVERDTIALSTSRTYGDSVTAALRVCFTQVTRASTRHAGPAPGYRRLVREWSGAGPIVWVR